MPPQALHPALSPCADRSWASEGAFWTENALSVLGQVTPSKVYSRQVTAGAGTSQGLQAERLPTQGEEEAKPLDAPPRPGRSPLVEEEGVWCDLTLSSTFLLFQGGRITSQIPASLSQSPVPRS